MTSDRVSSRGLVAFNPCCDSCCAGILLMLDLCVLTRRDSSLGRFERDFLPWLDPLARAKSLDVISACDDKPDDDDVFIPVLPACDDKTDDDVDVFIPVEVVGRTTAAADGCLSFVASDTETSGRSIVDCDMALGLGRDAVVAGRIVGDD